MERYSSIIIRGVPGSKKVRITSDIKPEIVSEMIVKWQSLLDATARIINVPAALIMKLNEDTIEDFLKKYKRKSLRSRGRGKACLRTLL